MPPTILPKEKQEKPTGFFASFSSTLLKVRSLLDLIINDLLRLVLVVLLFVLIVITTIGVISYEQWLPQVTQTVETLLGMSPAASDAAPLTP